MNQTNVPKKLLLNYSIDTENDVRVALDNLKRKKILSEQRGLPIVSVSDEFQKEIQNIINISDPLNRIAILEKILQILILEESRRKEGRFPYSGFMQDVILIAINVWEQVFQFPQLVVKYSKSLQTIAIASFEEVKTKSTSVLFFSKTIRHLSKIFGPNDAHTLGLRLCMSSITAKNGKMSQALKELDSYIKYIGSSEDRNVRSLMCNALAAKANVLKSEKMYDNALGVCNMILDLDTTKFNIHRKQLVSAKHLKVKIFCEVRQYETALEISKDILKEIPLNCSLTEEIKYSQAKIYHRAKNYQKAITLLDAVIATNQDRFDPTHSSVLAAKTQKAEVLEDMEQYDESIAEYVSVLKISETIHGIFHMKSMHTKANIARVLVRKGKRTEATTLLNQMLDSAHKKFGSGSEEAINISDFKNKILNNSKIEEKECNTTPNCYSEFKNYYIEIYELPMTATASEIEKCSLRALNEKNWSIAVRDATMLYNKIYENAGEDSSGLEQPLDILRQAHKKMGSQREELAALLKLYRLRLILLKIAELQDTINNKAAALVSYETLYKYIIKLKGIHNERVIGILKKIADLQLVNYQYEDAITSFQNLKQIVQNKKSDALEELEINYNIALCHMKLARTEEAVELCAKLMKDYNIVFCGKITNNNKYQCLNNFVQNLNNRLQRKVRK
jgi:tetratricopeptide (TPR) repeat protein